jgi:hypothetical protein
MNERTTIRLERKGTLVKYGPEEAVLVSQFITTETKRPVLVTRLRFERQVDDMLKTSLIMKGVRISVSYAHGGDTSALGKKLVFIVEKRDEHHAVATLLTVEQDRALRKFHNATRSRYYSGMIINTCRREMSFLQDVTRKTPETEAKVAQPKAEMTDEGCVAKLYEALRLPELENLDDSGAIATVKRALREKRLARGRNQPRGKRPTRARLRALNTGAMPQETAVL